MYDWILIFAMAAATFLPRALPFVFAGRLEIPDIIREALSFVPIAVLTAIVIQNILFRQGELALSLSNLYLLSGIAAFVTALLFRRLFVTIIVGLTFYVLLKAFFV